MGRGNTVTIRNLRMFLSGPNKDAEIDSYQTDMDFERRGNEKCMKEFFTHKLPMYCIIMLKSGTLRMEKCSLSLE